MTKRIWIALAVVASLAGCVQPATVSDSTRLKEDEGIIVYRMRCGPGIAWGQVFRSGDSAEGYWAEYGRAGMLHCPDGVQTKKLQAGHYFIGKIGFEGVIDFTEETATQFEVAAGSLNYIGDIGLPSTVEKRAGRRVVLISDPVVTDRREEALAWLAANRASLHGQYEFVASLARSPNKPAAKVPAGRSGEPN